MQKIRVVLPEIKLAGLKTRTNNKNELNWEHGKIFPCVHQYFNNNTKEKIQHRIKPGTTFCVYTDYESDHTGEYTYFIGEEVASFDNLSPDLEKCVIRPQVYAKFTTEPGSMPDVVKNAWKKVWQLQYQELGGKRNYHADFEIYDDRASDPTHQNIILDLYIGIIE